VIGTLHSVELVKETENIESIGQKLYGSVAEAVGGVVAFVVIFSNT
jgi:hypothetical protein